MSRRYVVLGTIMVGVIVAGGGWVTLPENAVARRGCDVVRSWWIWGANPPPPPADSGVLQVPLPEGGDQRLTLSGTLSYRNGHRGWRGCGDLPVRYVGVHLGGISLAIQDARWWQPVPDGDFLRTVSPGLVASISCSAPGGPGRTLASEVIAFEGGDRIELDLPFEIAIRPRTPDGDADDDPAEVAPLEYEVTLGGLHVTGRQRPDARSGAYDPVLFLPTSVCVGAVAVHGVQDTRYAEMTFVWNGRPLEFEASTEDRGTWLLSTDGMQVEAWSLITGPMSSEFR